MDVKIADNLKNNRELSGLIQQATKQLEDVVGTSNDSVRAEWDQTSDNHGRPVITLRLTDWTGTVQAQFRPNDLKSPLPLELRLLRLWGDLLQIRSHRQVDDLRHSVEALQGE